MTQFSDAAHAVQLDHLVVVAATLEAGAQHVVEALGVEPVTGGRHPGMGTHNRLLNLGSGQYLEIIAIDPDAPAPVRPRWFGLDQPAMRTRLDHGPFLAHWVARVGRPKDLMRWRSQYPARIGPVLPMARGDFQWRISVSDDGSLPGDGLLPTLIQWQTPLHPTQRLPEAQLTLRALRGFHARAPQLQNELAWLGASHLLKLEATLVEPSLMAVFETPDGPRVLK
jgi:Glyoxalase-like domain